MRDTKSVKSLKKQLAAAIAMVMVAAVALGASTYAWFVTNNKVEATTSTISAQSNAAFMKIKYNASAVDSNLTADKAVMDSEALYPAQWANNTFNEDGTPEITDGELVTGNDYQFETAYGTDPTAAGVTMVKTTLKKVGDPDQAVTDKYAVKNVFNISSKGTNLDNLKVSAAVIDSNDKSVNSKLDNALRILIVCQADNSWVLCDKDGVISDSEGRTKNDNDTTQLGVFGKGVTVKNDENTEVDMYVYYDGNDAEIYSNNLKALEVVSSKITVTFTAEAQNH